MKNTILSLMLLLFSIKSFSQKIDYPLIHVDSLGKTVITMTIEQAQILDNKIDLLYLLEDINLRMYGTDSICLSVINEKGIIIANQDIKIYELESLLENKSQQVENIKNIIAQHQIKEMLYKDELSNKDKEISLHLDEVKRVRKKMRFSSIASGVIITSLVGILILR
jgi:hypothetical protein